jgi:hypothetical protein
MKIAVIGHSHINCIQGARREVGKDAGSRVSVVQLRNPELRGHANGRPFYKYQKAGAAVARATEGAALAVLCPTGNQHFLVSMMMKPGVRDDELLEHVRGQMKSYRRWLAWLMRYVRAPAAVLPAPPPYESDAHVLEGAGKFADKFRSDGVPPAALRLRAWRHQLAVTREIAAAAGVRLVELPPAVCTERGYLREEYVGKGTHANNEYGAIVLEGLFGLAAQVEQDGSAAQSGAPATPNAGGRQHPYQGLPDIAYWKQGVAEVHAGQLDPVGTVPYTISRTDRVATAGSCFAQHISKRIREAGFQFLVTEAPSGGEARVAERGYYDFSARYGNLYTARQLVQLFDRAFGYFTPVESHWPLPGGRWCDPFRPRIEPDGYETVAALEEDRRRHLAAVKAMFEQLDVMVFTLGLTECWVSRLDGAALPLAPGVSGGVFDPARYAFVNFGVEEVAGDLDAFIRKLRLVNPRARLLLTVSPVPLVATYEPNHVLVSTTYSKSVLRVAADQVRRSHEDVCYFPSYEIIAGHYNRGRYFGPDLRSVTEEGVDHVMAVFMSRMTDSGDALPGLEDEDDDPEIAELKKLAEAECDEEVLGKK